MTAGKLRLPSSAHSFSKTTGTVGANKVNNEALIIPDTGMLPHNLIPNNTTLLALLVTIDHECRVRNDIVVEHKLVPIQRLPKQRRRKETVLHIHFNYVFVNASIICLFLMITVATSVKKFLMLFVFFWVEYVIAAYVKPLPTKENENKPLTAKPHANTLKRLHSHLADCQVVYTEPM